MLRCLALLACIPLSGCATLSGSRVEYLRVESIPQGAAVDVNGVGGGYTPAAVELDKHHPSVVQVSMAGQPPIFCSTEPQGPPTSPPPYPPPSTPPPPPAPPSHD